MFFSILSGKQSKAKQSKAKQSRAKQREETHDCESGGGRV